MLSNLKAFIVKPLHIQAFFRKYGFRLALILFVFLLVLFKDLNFQLNLKAPQFTQKPGSSAPASPILAGNQPGPQAAGPTAYPPADEEMDRFDINPLSAGRLQPDPPTKSTKEPEVSISEGERQAFFKRFAHVAVNEKERYGIPASLILANGLLLSQAARSDLSQRAHNFFALPCTADWQGQRHFQGNTCFRAYENAWTSFRDNSIYLSGGKFAALRRLESDDYRAWAKALEQASYYPEGITSSQVIELIEKNKLFLHDR